MATGRLPIATCHPMVVELLWPHLTTAAARWNVPAELLMALAWEESGCNPEAVRPDGRAGLFAMRPEEALRLARELDMATPPRLEDCGTAVTLAACLLGDWLLRFHHMWLVILAWHQGVDVVCYKRMSGGMGDMGSDAFLQRVVGSYLWLLDAQRSTRWWPRDLREASR